MPTGLTPLFVLDLLLRGGDAVLLLMVGAVLARDFGQVAAARLGAFFALGSAAYALCSTPVMHVLFGLWTTPLTVLASGNNLVLFLFARALFDDRFRPRAWHAGLWALIVGLDMASFVLPPAIGGPLGALMPVQALAFALAAGAQALSSWREDLVERRRRLRLFVVVAAAGHTAATALFRLAGQRMGDPAPNLAEAAVLSGIAVIVAWSLLQVADGQALFPGAQPQPAAPAVLDAADLALVARLERLMREERAYRQEGLTIGQLALRLDLPEYRLRRLINRGLGHRNFATFLNGYRLDDAKAALADPGQTAVPILTIALDAGFGSLGPFNRAFRAETGQTPTEFRRAHARAA